jgi:hypothetical protein
MPRFDPVEFERLLAHLTPHDLRQTEVSDVSTCGTDLRFS